MTAWLEAFLVYYSSFDVDWNDEICRVSDDVVWVVVILLLLLLRCSLRLLLAFLSNVSSIHVCALIT